MGSAHGSTESHASNHSHHDDFDPEPAKELAAGEPLTPTWLPILGAGLFLMFAVYFLVGQSSANQAAASASASAAKSAPKPAASAPAAPAPRAPAVDLDKLRRPNAPGQPSGAPMPPALAPRAGRGAPAPGGAAPAPAPAPGPRP